MECMKEGEGGREERGRREKWVEYGKEGEVERGEQENDGELTIDAAPHVVA